MTWKSVNVEMPPNTDPVLVSIVVDAERNGRIMILACWLSTESRWADLCDDIDPTRSGDQLTHWMSLPEPP